MPKTKNKQWQIKCNPGLGDNMSGKDTTYEDIKIQNNNVNIANRKTVAEVFNILDGQQIKGEEYLQWRNNLMLIFSRHQYSPIVYRTFVFNLSQGL